MNLHKQTLTLPMWVCITGSENWFLPSKSIADRQVSRLPAVLWVEPNFSIVNVHFKQLPKPRDDSMTPIYLQNIKSYYMLLHTYSNDNYKRCEFQCLLVVIIMIIIMILTKLDSTTIYTIFLFTFSKVTFNLSFHL